MKLNFGGGPSQPIKSITVSPGNAPIGSREWEKMQRKKRRQKNLTPLADSPRYEKQVAKEREARTATLLKQNQTTPADPERIANN